MKTLTSAELVKAAKPLSEHIAAAKSAVTDHVAKMCKAQDEHCDKMKKMHKAHGEEMHDTLGKCMKLMGAEEADKDEGTKSGTNEPEPIDITAEGTESTIKALVAKGYKITAPEGSFDDDGDGASENDQRRHQCWHPGIRQSVERRAGRRRR